MPQWPNIGQIDEWVEQICEHLVAASRYTDKKEVAWLLKIKRKEVTFQDLEHSGRRYAGLDSKLCSALKPTFVKTGDFRRLVRMKQRAAIHNQTTLTGRQLAWMVLDYFKTSEHMHTVSTCLLYTSPSPRDS